MLAEIGWSGLTALLSSVFTIALAKVALDRWGARFVRQRIEEAEAEIERRVRAGAVKAGQDLLPELGVRLQEAFEQALISLATGNTLERTMHGAATAGVRTLGERLQALFRGKRD